MVCRKKLKLIVPKAVKTDCKLNHLNRVYHKIYDDTPFVEQNFVSVSFNSLKVNKQYSIYPLFQLSFATTLL